MMPLAVLLSQVVGVAPVPNLLPAPPLTPAAVIVRYARALAGVRDPLAVTFDYTLEQTGLRTLAQTHRVFRSGWNERDETLSVDGKRLSPPKVRIFTGRRNRYTVGVLAPRVADYAFALTGLRRNGHHIDYVFHLVPHGLRTFATKANAGTGTATFARNSAWWIPYVVTAQATVAHALAAEKLSFYTYRFPLTLPSSTFTQPRRQAPLPAKLPVSPVAGEAIAPPNVPQRVVAPAQQVVPPRG